MQAASTARVSCAKRRPGELSTAVDLTCLVSVDCVFTLFLPILDHLWLKYTIGNRTEEPRLPSELGVQQRDLPVLCVVGLSGRLWSPQAE